MRFINIGLGLTLGALIGGGFSAFGFLLAAAGFLMMKAEARDPESDLSRWKASRP